MQASGSESAEAAEIIAHFKAERYDEARSMLDVALRENGHPRFKRIDARFKLFEGNEQAAAETLTEIYPRVWRPVSWELALMGRGVSRARILPAHKTLFIPVPKCGSTSLMNVLKLVSGEEPQGEDIHQEDHKKALVRPARIPLRYKDFFSCALVRSPHARLASFFEGNIVARDELAIQQDGRATFYGLPTRPDWQFFLENLDRYRQLFITVRNHTEPLISFIGNAPERFTWIGPLEDMADLVKKLSAWTGIELPVRADMASPPSTSNDAVAAASIASMNLYARDYEIYGGYF